MTSSLQPRGFRRLAPAPVSRPGPARLAAFVLAAMLCAPAGIAFAAKAPADGESGWPEITASEKSLTSVPEDPEADAVVLVKERDGRILRQADDLVNVIHYHWRMKILSERGKRYGEQRIRASKGSRVDELEARTIRPDGSIVPVTPDQIFEKLIIEVGSQRVVDKVFNFPSVEPGAIIEYRYTRYDNGMLFLDPYYFAGEELTVRSRVSQGFLAGTSYTILCDLCPQVQPVIGEWRDAKQKGQLYSLELRNLPGYRDEALMPPERETTPRLDMVLHLWKGAAIESLGRQDRFFIDWASVAQYAGFYYARTIKDGQAALKPIVEGWVQGAADPAARVKVILRHVQDDFRYIDWDTVVGGTRRMDTILKDKSADNEEKAVLFLAALKTIGIDGLPVLVASKEVGSVNPKFFSMTQFTHVIVALPKPDGTREYLDPTLSYAPYGFVSWKDSGAGALVINGKEGELIDLPTRLEVSATRYRVTLQPRTDGGADIDLQAEFNGEDAIDVREALVPASEAARETWIKDWLQARRPGATLTAHSIENLDAIDKPLVLKLSFGAPGMVTIADEVDLVHACVISCRDTNPLSRATRTHPFYVDRGWNLEEAVTIRPPKEGMVATQMPPMAVAKSAIANMSMSCSAQGDGSARCLRSFVARRNRWPASEQPAARAMYDKMIQADRATVAFAAPGS